MSELKKPTPGNVIEMLVACVNRNEIGAFYQWAEKYQKGLAVGGEAYGRITQLLRARPKSMTLLDTLQGKMKGLLSERPEEEENVFISAASQAFLEPLLTEWRHRDLYAYHNLGVRSKVLLFGPTGNGKCLGLNTPVLMSDGRIKAVQDIVAGEAVMGPDSLPRNVVSVARGQEEMYRVTPVKGDSFTCNASHILSFKNVGKETRFAYNSIVNLSVTDWLALPTSVRHCLKVWRSGVEFASKPVDVSPYFLGLWLGDGHTATPRITNMDPEITQYLQEFSLSQGLTCKLTQDSKSKAVLHSITGERGAGNSMQYRLRKLGVLNNKHIPAHYLHNSREVRQAVLAGLIDSDGNLRYGGYEIATVSEQLKNDILYLSRSLGLAAYSQEKPNMKRRTFRISINGNLEDIPCLLPRKQAQARRQVKNVLHTGCKIESIGRGDYYGFELSGPDRLFLLGDFTVTHNTTIARYISRQMGLPFVEVKVDSVIDSHLGTSGRNINAIFENLKEPCVLFWDEVDSIGRRRGGVRRDAGTEVENERMVNSMLLNLDRLDPAVIFIGATNRRKVLDSAFVRRFDAQFEVGHPLEEEKQAFARQLVAYHQLPADFEPTGYEQLASFSDVRQAVLASARCYVTQQIKASR